MNSRCIFISCVQKEFAEERLALRDFLQSDPLLAEPLYLTKHIERMGIGTLDMIRRCHEAGLPEPRFAISDGLVIMIWKKTSFTPQVTPQVTPEVTPQVTPQVGTKLTLSRNQVDILYKCLTDAPLQVSIAIAGRFDRTKFRNQVLNPLMEDGLIEMTIPDKPRSSKQKYRLAQKGMQVLEAMEGNNL